MISVIVGKKVFTRDQAVVWCSENNAEIAFTGDPVNRMVQLKVATSDGGDQIVTTDNLITAVNQMMILLEANG